MAESWVAIQNGSSSAESFRGTAQCNNNVIDFNTRSWCDFSSVEGVWLRRQSCSCASFFRCQHRSVAYGALVMRMQRIRLVCQRLGRRFSCFSQQLKLQCNRSTVAVLWAVQMQHIERELQYRGCSGNGRVMGSNTEWQQQCRVEWQQEKHQQHGTSTQSHAMHSVMYCLSTLLMLRGSVEILCIWGSISCALGPKFWGRTRVHLIYKT